MKTEVFDEIEIIAPYPAIYIPKIDSIVVADLHLGYEIIAAERGVFIPKTQFKKELSIFNEILKKKKASKIIINGDVKNEFSSETYHEFKEVRDMLKFLKNNFEQVIIIKGNHDNYIYYVTSKLDVELYEELSIENYLFTHGHKDIRLKALAGKTLVIGHEHPVIALYDEVGAKEVIKCFLFGKTEFGKILILPAFSILSYGTEMNFVLKEELLSPILKMINLNKLEIVGIDEEVGFLKFGPLEKLKSYLRS